MKICSLCMKVENDEYTNIYGIIPECGSIDDDWALNVYTF